MKNNFSSRGKCQKEREGETKKRWGRGGQEKRTEKDKCFFFSIGINIHKVEGRRNLIFSREGKEMDLVISEDISSIF